MFNSTTEKIIKVIATIASICTISIFLITYIIPSVSEKKEEKQKEIIKSSTESKEKNKLTPEQKCVDYCVPLCKDGIFSVEYWLEYSGKELYYIRNGIYAYEGMYFISGFYDVFEWYTGDIMQDDFTDDMLNDNQSKNVANIMEAEEIIRQN